MVVCVVTVHGIGFQQAPDDSRGVRGYADHLHDNLHAYFDGQHGGDRILGDDPNRLHDPSHVRGPIYVQSMWQGNDGTAPSREAGLRRLGTWNADKTGIDHADPKAALADGDAPVAHIALVYSNLERSYAQDPGP